MELFYNPFTALVIALILAMGFIVLPIDIIFEDQEDIDW